MQRILYFATPHPPIALFEFCRPIYCDIVGAMGYSSTDIFGMIDI